MFQKFEKFGHGRKLGQRAQKEAAKTL